jgi:hypothetical protein
VPVAASAQLGFGRVADRPYSGRVTVINRLKAVPDNKVKIEKASVVRGMSSSPTIATAAAVPPRVASVNLREVFDAQWREVRANMIRDALAFLNERDIGGGFRTSRNTLLIAEDGPLFAGWDGRGFTLRFSARDNRLSTYLRTPTPLSRDVDPGFYVNFDLDVILDIEVRNNQLVAGPARIEPHVKPPVGKNVTGALAVAAADLAKTLTGADFVGILLKEVNGRSESFPTGLNRELAKLNPILMAAAKGGTIMPGFDAQASSITLTLQNVQPAPIVH